MRVEVWADFVCPWCYLGKRRLEQALESLPAGDDVEVVWRSFQLDPGAPRFGEPGAGELSSRHLERKLGTGPERVREMQGHLTALAAADGLDYRLDRSRYANTLDAHRLAHAAAGSGAQDDLVERLFRAALVDGGRVDDPATLAEIAAAAGVSAGDVAGVLEGESQADAVRADLEAARQIGIGGVPFFVIGRRYGLSGAQPAETLVAALEQARADAEPVS